MAEPTPEELVVELHAEAARWAISADALVNASNAADEAAELLDQAAAAYDATRRQGANAATLVVELRSFAVRIGFAGAVCRDRSTTIRARITATMEAPK